MKTILFAMTAMIASVSLGVLSAAAPTSRPATRPAITPADDVIKNLLKPPPPEAIVLQPAERSATDKTSGPGAVAPGAPAVTIIREGTHLVDRVGRMARSADGQVEFSFEADGRSLQNPPVILLPNLQLMRMENAAAEASRDLKFRVTGMVTEYKGRNYLLLDKVVVVSEK